MSFYADTADLQELEHMLSTGIFNGVTTNPKILGKANPSDYVKRIREICDFDVVESVSVELTQPKEKFGDLFNEGYTYHQICPEKVVVKVPMWADGTGVALATALESEGIPVNLTCLMSVNQAITGCLAGCRYVSLFYNRMKDYYEDAEAANAAFSYTRKLIDRYEWPSKIIAGSIRKPEDVGLTMLMGADVVTVPYRIFEQLFYHEKTVETIAEFDDAWRKYKGG